MKILVTGTHFTPAVAVINELKKYNADIVYVGRKTTIEGDPSKSIESEEIPKLGVKFIPIITGRLQRTFTQFTIPSLLKIPIGLVQSFWIILKEKPDVILSFGGYISTPLVLVGWLFSIPIIVHEQTLVGGVANKINNVFADKIATSFHGNQKNTKTIFTGNPIRDEILHPSSLLPSEYLKLFKTSKRKNLPVVLIMGGNQGSHVINISVEEILDKLINICSIIHVTGENKSGDFERLSKRQNDNYLVKRWIGEEIGHILKKVDFSISRAGINTLSELSYFGIHSLVIPIPYLYQDEQNKNAEYFKKLGFVKILPQSKLSGKTLMENIKAYLNDLNHLSKQSQSTKKVIIPSAGKRLALETILLSKNA